jgi:RNA polymerase-binding transcription factor DksA
MATKKPAPKKAAKPAPKKVAPAKKIAKPVAKPAPKKAAPTKKVAKPAAKPAPKKAAPTKKVVKPIAKPAPKKAAPAKKAVAPAHSKKVVAKPVVKPAAVTHTHPKVESKKTVPPPPATKPVKKPEPPKEVKVPKTSVKTSVPYSPGYTPLEKRIETSKPSEPMVRYTDTELNEFKELISKKLDAAKKELAYLQGLITRKDEMGGDESESRYMTMEDGGMSMEREQLSQMASRQITYIDHLEKAIMRIENKTYGICRVTGRLIDKARLRAVPHATLSLEAKLGLVKPSNEQ